MFASMAYFTVCKLEESVKLPSDTFLRPSNTFLRPSDNFPRPFKESVGYNKNTNLFIFKSNKYTLR